MVWLAITGTAALMFLSVEPETESERAKREAETRRWGWHCLAPVTRQHRALKRAVLRHMKDPDSFEHIETRTTEADENGNHNLTMTYRARNSFGGMTGGQVYAEFDNESCNVTRWWFDE